MKKLFIIANWKSNKTTIEAVDWLDSFKSEDLGSTKEIIICPPFTLLVLLKLHQPSNVLLGSQNVSPYEQGAYTGEINAQQIKEFAEYSIIGHSERRNNFSETDELLRKKVEMAVQSGITPIFCVQNAETVIPAEVTLVAYEPVFAIGTGTADTHENAESVIKTIKEKNPQVKYVLYGGSVTQGNVHEFTQEPSIDGVLVGGASLDAEKFMQIVKNA